MTDNTWQTRRRLEAHLADKAQTRGFRQEAGRRGGTPGRREAHQAEELASGKARGADHTLGFRQEAGKHTTRDTSGPHLASGKMYTRGRQEAAEGRH